MAVTYRFDIVDGSRIGDSIPLKAGQNLIIGRTKQGVDLLDPRVSTRHCELSWDEGRLWVQDLNSATGTMVDGVAIGPEPVPLSDGHRLLVGDTVLQFIEVRRLLPQWVYWVALVVLLISAPMFILQLIEITTPWSRVHPSIAAPDRVVGHDGGPVHPDGNAFLVPLDRCFLRETLPLGGASRVHKVNDHDKDGVSEIWMEGPNWERVYTFDARDQWKLLGQMPRSCTYTPGVGNRPLSCDIRQYQFRAGVPYQGGQSRCVQGSNKGSYVLQDRRNAFGGTLDGVYVWLPNVEEDGPAGAPRPYAVGNRNLDQLAGWLYDRGIQEPVHAVVCEEMFEGMGAHVITASGRIEKLDPGCGYSLEIRGNATDELTKGEAPLAVAFTDTGRRLIGEQVSVFLGGSELRHFQNAQQAEYSRIVSATPQYRTADYLVLPEGGAVRRTTLPREDPYLRLDPKERLGGVSVPGRRRADTWVWTRDNESHILRTPCNSIVQIDTFAPICPTPCLSSSVFMRISVPSNGGKFEIPYQDMKGRRFQTPDRQVEISVDIFTPPGLVSQVIAASVAARDMDEKKVCNDAQYSGPEIREQ